MMRSFDGAFWFSLRVSAKAAGGFGFDLAAVGALPGLTNATGNPRDTRRVMCAQIVEQFRALITG